MRTPRFLKTGPQSTVLFTAASIGVNPLPTLDVNTVDYQLAATPFASGATSSDAGAILSTSSEATEDGQTAESEATLSPLELIGFAMAGLSLICLGWLGKRQYSHSQESL